MYLKRDVGSQIRLGGRLFAHPPTPVNLAPLRVHSGRKGILFQGPPVRAFSSPLGFFKAKRLGLTINWRKSSLAPARKLEYLGVMIDLEELTFSLPQAKVDKVKYLIQSIQPLS